jgi:hypothetical protein
MKTITIEIDEEITTIISKIEKVHTQNIVLLVPRGATLFQSSVNLKILKKKVEEMNKHLEIYTNDKNGVKIIKKHGISFYEGSVNSISKRKDIQISSLTEKKPQKLRAKKKSLTELVTAEYKKNKVKPIISKPQTEQQKKERRRWAESLLQKTIKRKSALALLLIAFLLLFFVSYIALPNATIYITPSSNIVEKTTNIILADAQLNKQLLSRTFGNSIPAHRIETTYENNFVYTANGKVFTGRNATCLFTLKNHRGTPWELIEGTRFQSDTGVIYRSQKPVNIPGAGFDLVTDEVGNSSRQKIPGQLSVLAIADEVDVNGAIIGARGNLKQGTKLVLPGLSTESREILFAEVEEDCKEGYTSYYSIVTQDDIDAAKEKMKQDLETQAKKILEDFVASKNLERGVNLTLFDNPQAIRTEILDLSTPPNIVDSELESFSVNGQIKIKGIAYNPEDYFEILEKSLYEKVHPHKRLSSIDHNSTTYSIVYSDSDLRNLSKVKLSVTVKGIEQYDFDPDSIEGKRLTNKIMEYIPNKTRSEAEYFITNLEEIDKASISMWPFWQRTIPPLESAVKIKLN